MHEAECFWCSRKDIRVVDEMPLCPEHDKCSECGKSLSGKIYGCGCDKYGYSAHEEDMWCSPQCEDSAHSGPEPDLDAWEEQEAERRQEKDGSGD